MPLSSNDVLNKFDFLLNTYEMQEISQYPIVHFLGMDSDKVKPTKKLKNFGYDDDHDNYKITIGDHLAYKYEILKIIGQGSHAQICKYLDHSTKAEVAIKIIKNHKFFTDQGNLELKILTLIDSDTNTHCIQKLDHFIFRSHICIVFELLSYSLSDLLLASNFQGFSQKLIKKFTCEILKGLKYLKKLEIIHCDLKPANIVLENSNDSVLKLIDFGSSCLENANIYRYVQNRQYRAPEVLLGLNYTGAIDMWSLGCTVGKMILGRPLFKGEDELDQLFVIIEALGLPPDFMLDQSELKERLVNKNGTWKQMVSPSGKIRKIGKNLKGFVGFSEWPVMDFLKSSL